MSAWVLYGYSGSPEDAVIGVKLYGDPKFPICVNVCVNGCLPMTGDVSRVYSVSFLWQLGLVPAPTQPRIK